jgi:hypothetical protein
MNAVQDYWFSGPRIEKRTTNIYVLCGKVVCILKSGAQRVPTAVYVLSNNHATVTFWSHCRRRRRWKQHWTRISWKNWSTGCLQSPAYFCFAGFFLHRYNNTLRHPCPRVSGATSSRTQAQGLNFFSDFCGRAKRLTLYQGLAKRHKDSQFIWDGVNKLIIPQNMQVTLKKRKKSQ